MYSTLQAVHTCTTHCRLYTHVQHTAGFQLGPTPPKTDPDSKRSISIVGSEKNTLRYLLYFSHLGLLLSRPNVG